MSVWGVGIKEFLPQIFAWGACYVPCQKSLCKRKYGFEGSILIIGFCLLTKQPMNL